ncbi:MAG: 2-amino-4-hydroxy-6-hydroxymethyldihydropteridine diphosphokinase [Gemmatimonadales bacterium]|nr:2-amino-4-hydroxy-6-hydroxymethyldihydropteridine diphosphokinase [Gemmatimonadales bacterium]
MPTAYVAVGSNLGDRSGWHAFAEAGLGGLHGVRVDAATTVHETAPLGGAEQPPYLNRMMRLDTTLSPHALLGACHDIERAAGRDRARRWASRTLDLDLVRYDDLTCDTPTLVLPHPGLRDRTFWAREIAELEAR